MTSSLSAAMPYVLATVVALLPRGAPLRCGGVGTALVALATAAAARVTGGPASFNTINGALLYGGWLLVATGVAMAWLGRRDRAPVSIVAAEREPDVPGVRMFLRRWGMPLLLGLLLIPSLWFFVTVAGPDATSLEGIRDVPFSAAGEILLAALLLPATLVLAGAWPFALLARGPRLAPVGAVILLVVVLPLLGEGLAHWRSVYAGWLVLAALIAAARADGPGLMASGGLFAIACGVGPGRWAGALLVTIAAATSIARSMREPVRRATGLAAVLCGLVALGGTLQAEVFYSVAMVLAAVLAVLRSSAPAEDGIQI